MADNWQVVRQRNGRESVVFDGTEDDARKYVADNFPRVHVDTAVPDSGSPDVLLKSPNGDYSAHVGPGNWQDTDEHGEKKKRAAKKTAGAPSFGKDNNEKEGDK